MEELLDEFQDDTGMDFKEEVLPWIGPDVSLAALDASGPGKGPENGLEPFDAAAMFGVKDHDAASDFLENWLKYMKDEKGAQFEEDSSGGFDIQASEGEQQIYALSRDWLVFATTADALEEVLDRISGDGGDSLADNPDFKQARALMSVPRVMSFYVDLETATDALSDSSGELVPGWLTVSARFVDRGMVIEIAAPGGAEFTAGLPGVGEPAVLLPSDTLGFIAASFDPNMDNWRAELEGYTLDDLGLPHEFEQALEELEHSVGGGDRPELDMRSTLAETLDHGLEIVEELTGINLEEDLFDHLKGRAVISVRDFEFDLAGDFREYAVDMAAMLSYIPDSQDDLGDTMDRVAGLIESSGLVRIGSADMGADVDATVFDLSGMMGETAYSPGYMLNDGYLTIGSTERVLETAAGLQKGGSGALADAPEYRRTRGDTCRTPCSHLMFLDLQRITGQLYPESIGMDPSGYRILAESLSAAAVGSKTEADYSMWVFVMTLFPE